MMPNRRRFWLRGPVQARSLGASNVLPSLETYRTKNQYGYCTKDAAVSFKRSFSGDLEEQQELALF
jgi:hypothetical protein